MNNLRQRRLIENIRKYQKKKGVKDVAIRNDIYESVRPTILAAIKSYFGTSRKFESEPEIIGLSWDVFDKYIDVIVCEKNIEKQWGDLSRRYVRDVVRGDGRKKRRTQSTTEKEFELMLSDHTHENMSDGFYSIREFRETLPDDYREVFDDSLLSLDDCSIYWKKREDNCSIPSNRYYEAKRVFRFVAEFLMGGRR